MRHQAPAPLAFATGIAISLLAISATPTVLRAQEAPRHDQQQSDDQRRDQGAAARPDDHRGGDREHAARGGDDADALRRDHPGATARCHDGFFTKSERQRACTRHGGIDVWLAPE